MKVFWLGLGELFPTLSQCWASLWVDLFRPCPCCYSLCEFLCVSALSVWKTLISWCHTSSWTQPYSSMSHDGKGLMNISHLRQSATEFPTLYTLSCCRSLDWSPSTSWESFADGGWLRHWSMGTAEGRNLICKSEPFLSYTRRSYLKTTTNKYKRMVNICRAINFFSFDQASESPNFYFHCYLQSCIIFFAGG